MNKLLFIAIVSSVLLVSCKKEHIAGSSENQVKVEVTANFETKAEFGELTDGKYPLFWSEGDKIQVALASVDDNNSASRSVFIQKSGAAQLSEGNRRASFEFTVSEIEGANRYQYFSYAPAGDKNSWGCWDMEKDLTRFILPSEQTPTATSPDPKSMVFYGKSVIYDSFETNPEITYEHLTGYGCLSFKNLVLGEGETVETVTLTADNRILAGQYSLMFGGNYQASKQWKSIIINTTATENIYFTVNTIAKCPDLNEGSGNRDFLTLDSEFTVKIQTNKGNILEKSLDVKNHPITFRRGKCTKFTVDMDGVDGTDPVFASGLYLLGSAAPGGIEMKAAEEDNTKYGFFGKLKAGSLKIAQFSENVPTYINHDGAFEWGVDENIVMSPSLKVWAIPADGIYRIIYDTTEGTVKIFNPAADSANYLTISGHFKAGTVDEDVTFDLLPDSGLMFGAKVGQKDNWSNKAELQHHFSFLDPQVVIIHDTRDVKGNAVIGITGWKTSNGEPYTNLNSCFYIFPTQKEKNNYQVKLGEWYDVTYGFLNDPNLEVDGTQVGGTMRDICFYFNNPETNANTPVNFMIIDFRNKQIKFDKR